MPKPREPIGSNDSLGWLCLVAAAVMIILVASVVAYAVVDTIYYDGDQVCQT